MMDLPSIAAFLEHATALAIAEIDLSGRLVAGNAGFHRLLPAGGQHRFTGNVAPYLVSPTFDELIAEVEMGRTPVYEGLLTLGDAAGKTRSLRGAVSRHGDHLLLVAEHDIEQLEQTWESAIQLSDEMSYASRELVSANHRLQLRAEEIRKLALTDQLTGLANRRQFQAVLEAETSRAHRYHTDLALVMADVDRFKAVNDTFGHDAGDAVLHAIAGVIQHEIRQADLAARYGGEEFAVLLPHTSGEAALVIAERIRTAVMHHRFEKVPAGVTISLGIAAFQREESAASLFKRADEALYLAKNRGRNRVVWNEAGQTSQEPSPHYQAR